MAINLANNNSLANITALPSSISGGGMTLISEQTASGSATIDFTSGIDSTYDSYVFKFINIHPSNDDANFLFNISIDNGSNYNVTKTSTFFRTAHNEGDSETALAYYTGGDLAQGTGNQLLSYGVGSDNDQCTTGYLQLFNPSSTTFVKHFISRTNTYESTNNSWGGFSAGYGNTTSAIDGVRFQMASGTFDGVIKLYGVS